MRVRVSRNAGHPFVEILNDNGDLLFAGFTVWQMESGPDGLVIDVSVFPPLELMESTEEIDA